MKLLTKKKQEELMYDLLTLYLSHGDRHGVSEDWQPI